MDIETEFKRKGTVSKGVTFPLLFWESFEQDCKEHFNDTYFLKIQHDHEFRKTFESTAAILADKILALEAQVEQLMDAVNNTETETKKEKKTFGK